MNVLAYTGSVIIDNNANMITLGTSFTSVLTLQITNNPRLSDWTSLYKLTQFPASFAANNSACPPFQFFSTASVFTPAAFAGCIDYLNVTSITNTNSPTTGGIYTVVTVFGVLASSSVNLTILNQTSPCTLLSSPSPSTSAGVSTLGCTSPAVALPGTYSVSIQVSPTRPPITTPFTYTYFTPASYFGANTSSAEAYVPAAYPASTMSVPGWPAPASAQVSSMTTTLIIVMAVTVGWFALSALVMMYCCDNNSTVKRRMEAFLSGVDVLRLLHEDKLTLTDDSGYILRRKSSALSGLVTIVTLGVAVTAVAALIIQLSLDNTAATNNLQPVDNAATAFASSYQATLQSVGATLCAASANTTACHPGLSISVTGFSTIQPTAGDGVSCEQTGSGCLIRYQCGACTAAAETPAIQVSDASANSYALSWAFALQSSDYFGAASVASGGISAPIGSVLKGSPAAEADVSVTPASFSNFGTVTNGVLAKVIGTSTGGSVPLTQFGSAQGVSVRMQVTAQQNGEQVVLSQKISAVSAIAQVGALISTAVGVGAAVVAVINFMFPQTNKKDRGAGPGYAPASPHSPSPVNPPDGGEQMRTVVKVPSFAVPPAADRNDAHSPLTPASPASVSPTSLSPTSTVAMVPESVAVTVASDQ